MRGRGVTIVDEVEGMEVEPMRGERAGIEARRTAGRRPRLPNAVPAPPTGARAWVARVIVACLSLAAALGLSEGALRLAGPGIAGTGLGTAHPPGMYLADEELGYRLRPGFRGAFEKASFRMSIEIDGEGFRHAPGGVEEAERVVLALGDSFTFGIGVDGDQTFSARLETMLDRRAPGAYRVINAGVPGYGTVQELCLLDRALTRVSPEVVLLCFYPNDLLDDAIDAHSRMVVDEAGNLVRRWTGEGPAPWNWSSEGSVPLLFKAFLRDHSVLYHVLQFHFRRFVERETLPRNWAVGGEMDPMAAYARLGADYLYLDGESDAIRALWAAEFDRLDEVRRRVEAVGACFRIVLVPTDHRVYPESREAAARWLNLDPGLFDDARVADALVRHAAAEGFGDELIDLGPALIAARDGGGPLYYRGDDRHFTARGHEVAARAIDRALGAEGMIDG